MKTQYKVCLDPGHDTATYNRSPVVREYCEGQRMWDLALLLKQRLEEKGIAVILTKSQVNQAVSLASRGKKSKGCDLFLSLHSNAASTTSPNWVTALHQVDDNCGHMDEDSAEIAGLLAQAVAALMGVSVKTSARKSSSDRDGNGYKDDYYGVLRSAHIVGTPGVILEHGFHTNEGCTRWLLEDSNLTRLATAEAEVITGWLKTQKAPETFVRKFQSAIGAVVDGIAGPETLSKTPTLSATRNPRHPAVKPVQQRLQQLGYTQVGAADGIAGRKFTAAVKAFQKDHGCVCDGEITAQAKTWRCLLGME